MSESIARRPLLAGALAAAAMPAQVPAALTVATVLDRIKASAGVPWRAQTVDNLIGGTPDTVVKGIATTMMATFDVVKRAHAAGRNLVITHEPTFYSHQDTLGQIRQDEIYLLKREFIDSNRMAVFHFHDHWHARRPDGIAAGMTQALGWEKQADPEYPRLFHFAPRPLRELVREIDARLKPATMRVLGDPAQSVAHVAASWGYSSPPPPASAIARPDVDTLIVGETREWELVEYVQDMISAGRKKSLIVLGHVVSEQAGMRLCAEWLKPIVPEVPIDFISAADPFWPMTLR